jgi:hypothetical protein
LPRAKQYSWHTFVVGSIFESRQRAICCEIVCREPCREHLTTNPLPRAFRPLP